MTSPASGNGALYGQLAEFDDPATLVTAARRAHTEGYRRMDAFTPVPIEGLAEALGFHSTAVPWVVLACGVTGAVCGYLLQYYAAVISYPLNIAGRPLHSWPAFVPVTFEMTVLFAALGAVLGMLLLNGLPLPYHPLFGVAQFARASSTGFFLCIRASDGQFDPDRTRKFLSGLGAREVIDVLP